MCVCVMSKDLAKEFQVCVCVCKDLAQQLQVCHGYFSFLVASLSHQPIRIHAWHSVHGDELIETRMSDWTKNSQKTYNHPATS